MPESTSDRDLLTRALNDWPRRLAFEAALLERLVAAAPLRRVLDLGCGEGHHARFLAERDCEVVGIDASEPAIEAAQEEPIPDGVQFVMTDLGAVERSVRGHFGAAICLGNTLPHLLSPESVSRMLIGLRRRLMPGTHLLIQTVNYDRIFDDGVRALPVEVRDSPEGELVVLGLVRGREDGIVLHTTSVLRFEPHTDQPLEVVATHQNQLRGWRREEIETMLEVARFSPHEVYGDMGMSPYDPHVSPELVVVAS